MKESRIRNGSSPVAKLRLRSDTWKSETIFWSAGRQKSRSTWRKQQLVEVFATAVTWTRSVASTRIWKASVLSTSDVNRPKPLVDLSNVASDDLLQNFITTLTMKTKGTTMMAGKIETFLVCKRKGVYALYDIYNRSNKRRMMDDMDFHKPGAAEGIVRNGKSLKLRVLLVETLLTLHPRHILAPPKARHKATTELSRWR